MLRYKLLSRPFSLLPDYTASPLYHYGAANLFCLEIILSGNSFLVLLQKTFFFVLYIQLFRERLSYKRGKAHVTMSKVIMGNGGFYSCLSEPQGVSARWKETTQTPIFVFSPRPCC